MDQATATTTQAPFPIVVRWSNGEIEGLVGWGPTIQDAKENALHQVRVRTLDSEGRLQAEKIQDSDFPLPRGEDEKIRRDWHIAGH